MKQLGTGLLCTGILLAALGGLEKILVFVAVTSNQSVMQMQAVLNLTPDYIWAITNITLYGGLLVALIGLLVQFAKPTTK
ncbi:MAG TPA: hypothetical protein VFV52_18500 [Bacilli bacterium]|nr:hypothetical protein [Bacilli bacterium]